MRNPQPKNFTWLFLATYADPKQLPVVLRTQAATQGRYAKRKGAYHREARQPWRYAK